MKSNYRQSRSGTIAMWFTAFAVMVMSAGAMAPASAQTFPVAFPAPTTFATGCATCAASAVSVATGDLNGDGKLDVVNIDYGSNLNIMLGKGDGTFQPPITTSIATANFFPEAIAVGDFNGNHVLDVAVWATNSNTGNAQVNIYLGTGTGGFTVGGVYNAPNSSNFNPGPNSIVAEDVNGDGKLDLVAMTPYNGVFVFLGNGDGTFQAPVVNATVCTGSIGNCESLAVGDLNGDGKPDLAFESNDTTGGGISILLNTGAGTFGTGTYYPVGIAGVFAGGGIAIGDVNGDKKPDVIVGSSSASAIVYLNQGGGTFAVKGTVGSVPLYGTNNVVLADINNDKKLDIVIPDGLGDVFTFYGTGKGTFTAGPAYPLQAQTNGGNYLVAVGDFNGDGTLDLLDTNGLNTNSVSLGRGDGSFQTNQLYASAGNLSAYNDVIATADFNGDGFADTAVVGNVNGDIGINLGSSHGVLGKTSLVIAGTCANNAVTWLATGDVNGDGKADIVATLQDATFAGCQNNTVAVLEGLGTGKFKKAAYYATGSTTQEQTVYLVDVNGDGKLDIVTGNADSSISVLLNKANGTYSVGVLNTGLTSILNHGISLTFADFNGDGKMDIAVTATVSPAAAVYVLLGNGNGTFGAPIQTATPYYPITLAAADFNKDGKADLLVTTTTNGCTNSDRGYAFLKGNGDGTFTTGALNCLSPLNPQTPVVADLNGDGKLDVVISGYGSIPTGPVVLQGNGDGTFTAQQTAYPGNSNLGAAIADFNGDGMPDIALLNSGGFNPTFISVMLNSTQPVSVSPLNVNYGSVTVGAKKPETVILTNNQSTPLAISGITLGGVDAGDFSESSKCLTSRKPGWDCTITVTFKPTVTGARSATLNIKDGAGTQTVALSGTGK
ncbi:MAG TPA: FG-GAP-like repeat-containing protein [Terriglobales bacterium]|nr:FG-GAP-like repeat-containing protein [Terriglobales bacterium]